MPIRSADLCRASAVPAELGGKWVAWNTEHTRIVAQAETLQQLWRTTREKQINDPVFEKIPRSEVRFVGAQ